MSITAENGQVVWRMTYSWWLDDEGHPWIRHVCNGVVDEYCTCGLDAALGFLAEEPVCSHSTYHHGCPSCDRQDPEDR